MSNVYITRNEPLNLDLCQKCLSSYLVIWQTFAHYINFCFAYIFQLKFILITLFMENSISVIEPFDNLIFNFFCKNFEKNDLSLNHLQFQVFMTLPEKWSDLCCHLKENRFFQMRKRTKSILAQDSSKAFNE